MDNTILDEEFQSLSDSGEFDRKTRAKINNIKIYVNTNIKDVKAARIVLFVIVWFLIIVGLINFFSSDFKILSDQSPIEAIGKALVYLLFAFYLKKDPKWVLVAALSFFLIAQLYGHFFGFLPIYKWAIFKIPILYILIQGINSARKLEKDAFRLRKLGVPEREIDLMKALKEVPNS